MRNDVTLRPETPADFAALDALVRLSFAKGTPYSDGTGEVALCGELRSGGFYIPDLALIAQVKGENVGHFMLTHLPLSPVFQAGHVDLRPRRTDLLLLSPVSVAYTHLRQGIGTAMLTQGLERARALGYKGVVVEGNPAFYRRLGYRTSTEYGIKPSAACDLPSPDCLMAQPLCEGGLQGIEGYVDFSFYPHA